MENTSERISLEGDPNELLTTKQVALILKISRTTLYNILETGNLKHVKIAGGSGGRKSKRIKRSWLEEYLNLSMTSEQSEASI